MSSKPPWRFHSLIYGQHHAILDADQKILACNVPGEDGPLMAAAPTMLAVLRRVETVLPEGKERDLVRRAIAVADPSAPESPKIPVQE
jgi:hypothetical protein